MAFKPAARGFRTMMGVDPASAVATLREAGAALVGCNCEITAEPMAELVPILAELNGGVTCAQPNAGQPRLEDGQTVYGETPEHFAAVVGGYPALGAAHRRRVLRHAARVHRALWPQPSAADTSAGSLRVGELPGAQSSGVSAAHTPVGPELSHPRR